MEGVGGVEGVEGVEGMERLEGALVGTEVAAVGAPAGARAERRVRFAGAADLAADALEAEMEDALRSEVRQ